MTPCKNCTERMRMCHARCEKYANYKKRLHERKDAENHIKQANQASYETHLRLSDRVQAKKR